MRYHLNKKGDVTPCRAKNSEACPIKNTNPPQFHAASRHEMFDYLEKFFGKPFASLKAKKPLKVPRAKLGTPETDGDRIFSYSKNIYGSELAHYWLKDVEGNPMAFINVGVSEDGVLALHDIEVRPEYRGHGLSKRLIKVVEDLTGKSMTHSGGYTPLGLSRVAPLFHSREEIESDPNISNTFEPMSFVFDWDEMIPEFPI